MFERALKILVLFTLSRYKPTFLQRSVKFGSPAATFGYGFSDAYGSYCCRIDGLMLNRLAVNSDVIGNDCLIAKPAGACEVPLISF